MSDEYHDWVHENSRLWELAHVLHQLFVQSVHIDTKLIYERLSQMRPEVREKLREALK
jgi:hypothetical protein